MLKPTAPNILLRPLSLTTSFLGNFLGAGGQLCLICWSEWQDLDLRPPSSRTKRSTVMIVATGTQKPETTASW
jgi:hypothetical protein